MLNFRPIVTASRLSCIATLLLFGACAKREFLQHGGTNTNIHKLSVKEARNWFNQKHAEDRRVMQSITGNSPQRLTSYTMGAFAGDPDWSKFKPYNIDQGLLITLDNTSGWGGKNAFRDLVLLKDQDGNIKEYIQEVNFDSTYLRKLLRMRRSTEGIRSYSDPKTFTGTVMLYTASNLFIRGAVYNDGILTGEIRAKGQIGRRSTESQNVLGRYIRSASTDTIELPEVIVTNPPTGGGGTPTAPGQPGGDGSGTGNTGNGGGSTGTDPNNQGTIPSTTDPCGAGSYAGAALSALYAESVLQQARAQLGNFAGQNLEKGFAMYEHVTVDSSDNTMHTFIHTLPKV